MESILLTKQDILKKISVSEKECSFLGIAYTDLNMDSDMVNDVSLKELLHKKFTTVDGYQIRIISEYFSQLVKYPNIDSDKLIIKQESFTSGLRKYFVDKKTKNIEPTDDVCRSLLDIVFYKSFIDSIVFLLSRSISMSEILSTVLSNFLLRLQAFLLVQVRGTSEYKKLLDEKRYKELGLLDDEINSSKTLNSIKTFFAEVDSFSVFYDGITKLSNLGVSLEIDCVNLFLKGLLKDKEKEIISRLSDVVLAFLMEYDSDSYVETRDYAAAAASKTRGACQIKYENDPQYQQRMIVKIMCDDIHQQMIKIDDEYYGLFIKEGKCWYRPVDKEEDIDYFQQCLENPNAGQLTKKGNRNEIVPCYIQYMETDPKTGREHVSRIRVGQRARDSFNYKEGVSMPFVKKVIWALIFDRNGNLLLHKRGINAKDNQDMWDKSVGGHIAMTDPDSTYGARREIVEELYTKEAVEQGHSDLDTEQGPDPERIIYLGQWDKERYPKFSEVLRNDNYIKLKDNESYCFKVETDWLKYKIVSKRILVNRKEVVANCFVDLYFVIASKDFNTTNLQNSEYLLVHPKQIKTFFETGMLPKDISSGKEDARFDVTPDLKNILSQDFWESYVVTFADAIKQAYSK